MTGMKLIVLILLVPLLAEHPGGNAHRAYPGVTGESPDVPDRIRPEDIFAAYKGMDSAFRRPAYDVFYYGMTGLHHLSRNQQLKNDTILTLIDLRMSSNLERLWIIDLRNGRILYNTLVAHGKNSGNEFAGTFSNRPRTNMTSLGFYLTGNKYRGKHGTSLYLDGMEPGINDNVRKRAIVMHSANYVSKDFSRKYGRIGRSFGCPAIPVQSHEEIINLLKGRSCMFVFYPDADYLNRSVILSGVRKISPDQSEM